MDKLGLLVISQQLIILGSKLKQISTLSAYDKKRNASNGAFLFYLLPFRYR